MIKAMTIITLVLVMCLAFASNSLAKQKTVKVTLPTFDVTINGYKIDNDYREYPFLVYKDITYVPMTWYDSRVLGLETTWSREKGLDIKKAKVTSRYEPYRSTKKNAKSYQAQIRQGTLTLNGKTITNESEEYPFLTFRNITYFPLTWRFAHDEFGWGYQWDSKNGLRITSHNPLVKDVGLPKSAGKNGLAQFKDHLYYVESNGSINHIYRMPVNQVKNKKKIFEYDAFAYEHMSQEVGFRHLADELLMNYKVGYFNHYQWISQDGGLKENYSHHRGSLDFRKTPYGKLVVVVGLPDEFNGNLHLVKDDGKIQQVGDPNVTAYGHSIFKDGLTPTTVVGDDVYILYRGHLKSELYRINLVTNETTLIIENVDWFVVGDNNLYFTNRGQQALYVANLDGTNAKQIASGSVTWFDVVNGNVFYTSKDNGGKQYLYKFGQHERLFNHSVSQVKVDHNQLFVVLDASSDHKSLILDAHGELLWELGEPVEKIYESDQGWLFKSARDEKIYHVR